MAAAEYSYDVTQYDSYPYKQTHPNHLRTIGQLFGLNATPFENARILELGCAAGGNIIPMAYSAPHAQIVGIDLSNKQIQQGQAVIDKLGLKNIELRHQSIADFTPKEGLFDYIICHGIFAWVPKDIQQAILGICKNNMAEHGIAFISYNTLPGWNMVRSIRDLMRYHVQNFSTPQEKAQQARGILEFVMNGLEGQNTPYAQFLQSEIDLLSKQADSYLLHDHLEDLNFPMYFHEFVSQAQAFELSYLSDTDLAQMFPANLPPSISQEISKITDIVRLGQYMDFVRNQRFRQTLLCHQSVKVNRNLRSEQIKAFYLKFDGVVEGDEEAIHVDGASLVFKGNYITVTLNQFLSKIGLWILSKETQPISYDSLVAKIMHQANCQDKNAIDRALNQDVNLMRLVLGGMIVLSVDNYSYAKKPGDLPKATPIVQNQLLSSSLLTNLRHEVVRINEVEKMLLGLCDGTLQKEHIGRALGEKLIKNNIPLYKEDGTVIQDKADIVRRSEYLADDLLNQFAKNALLVAD